MSSRSLLVLAFCFLVTLAKASRDGVLPCALIGDSIAVEAGQYLPACKLNAKIGIPSGAVISRVDSNAQINVVSAGSNDPRDPNLRTNLELIRARAKRVIWILPAISSARAAVREVAIKHGDIVVAFEPRRDGVHPASSARLAQAIDAVIADNRSATDTSIEHLQIQ